MLGEEYRECRWKHNGCDKALDITWESWHGRHTKTHCPFRCQCSNPYEMFPSPRGNGETHKRKPFHVKLMPRCDKCATAAALARGGGGDE